MAKVSVTVASMGNEVAGDDAVESIALADVPRTATWTLPGDTLSNYGNGELIDLYGNGSSYTGYALPGEAEDLTLRITMESGRIFTATVSSLIRENTTMPQKMVPSSPDGILQNPERLIILIPPERLIQVANVSIKPTTISERTVLWITPG